MLALTKREPALAPPQGAARANGSSLVALASDFGKNIRPTKAEIDRFREMFYTLVFKTTFRDRQIIASHLCRTPYLPRQIAFYLALEELPIARPILAYSPVLKQRDLEAVAAKCGATHSEIIANRDGTVLKKLSTQEPTQPVQTNIQPVQSVRPSNSIKDAKLATPVALPKLADKLSLNPAKDDLLKLANRGGRLSRAKISPQSASHSTNGEFEKLLLTAARQHDYTYLGLLIEQQMGVSAKRVEELIQTQNAGMLAALLRAMDMPRVAAGQLLLLLHRNAGRNAQLFRVVLDRYDTMDTKACRKAFGMTGSQQPISKPSIDRRRTDIPLSRLEQQQTSSSEDLSKMEARLLQAKTG